MNNTGPYRHFCRCVMAACLIFLFGCSTAKPTKGGGSKRTVTSNGATNTTEMTAPESPNAKSSQKTKVDEKTTLTIGAGSVLTTRPDRMDGLNPGIPVATISGPTNRDAAPTTIVHERHEETGTELGSSYQDNSPIVKAAYANMRPVQIAGLLIMLGGVAIAYFTTWKMKGAVIAVGGLCLIFVAHAVVGHETLVAVVALSGVIGFVIWSRLVYKTGHEHGQEEKPK